VENVVFLRMRPVQFGAEYSRIRMREEEGDGGGEERAREIPVLSAFVRVATMPPTESTIAAAPNSTMRPMMSSICRVGVAGRGPEGGGHSRGWRWSE
jgi:hypothetical protein